MERSSGFEWIFLWCDGFFTVLYERTGKNLKFSYFKQKAIKISSKKSIFNKNYFNNLDKLVKKISS